MLTTTNLGRLKIKRIIKCVYIDVPTDIRITANSFIIVISSPFNLRRLQTQLNFEFCKGVAYIYFNMHNEINKILVTF